MVRDSMLGGFGASEIVEDAVIATKVDAQLEEQVKQLCGDYETWLSDGDILHSSCDPVKLTEVATPHAIKAFCLSLVKYKEEKEFSESGAFLTAAIRRSYDAGNNNFTLPLKGLDLDNVCDDLHGYMGSPPVITIEGNIEGFNRASCVHATIDGDLDGAQGIFGSTLIIHGDLVKDMKAGDNASCSYIACRRITIQNVLHQTRNCHIAFCDARALVGNEGVNNTFYSPSKEALEMIGLYTKGCTTTHLDGKPIPFSTIPDIYAFLTGLEK